MKDETVYYTLLDDCIVNNQHAFLTEFERLIYLQLLEYFRFEDGKGVNGSVKTTVDFI